MQNGANFGCIARRNARTAACSAAVRSRNQLPRNHLQEMTRAGFEPATYGLKGRRNFIPRGRPGTSKFVPVLKLSHALFARGPRSSLAFPVRRAPNGVQRGCNLNDLPRGEAWPWPLGGRLAYLERVMNLRRS